MGVFRSKAPLWIRMSSTHSLSLSARPSLRVYWEHKTCFFSRPIFFTFFFVWLSFYLYIFSLPLKAIIQMYLLRWMKTNRKFLFLYIIWKNTFFLPLYSEKHIIKRNEKICLHQYSRHECELFYSLLPCKSRNMEIYWKSIFSLFAFPFFYDLYLSWYYI